ncbi:hypothetical protein XF_0182 [Xylella fastidiosa 9a5c]|uniref:Uncharacterized protein n=1 Tax=Xylella fastidiosa (strain 9a5c) TaxID=160492 RepID=Q9PGW6_XYLFA|nr:hypothetical protein XF_0182 [Xylella fastidiosa 9a5c]
MECLPHSMSVCGSDAASQHLTATPITHPGKYAHRHLLTNDPLNA